MNILVMNILIVTVGAACFVGCAVAVGIALYSFVVMLRNERPGNSIWLTSLLGPLILFIPGLWTVDGNRARMRFIYSSLVFGVCFLILILLGFGRP